MILEQTLSSDSEVGYCGTLSLIHHLCLADINLKLEITRHLLTTTFTKLHSPNLISQQIGWQESISRLLVKKPIANLSNDNKNVVDDISFDDNSDILNDDLIIFDEKTMELNYQSIKDSGMILTEKLHAHVSEAAHVIESEIKEFADQVSGAVAGNISSVYSVIKSTTAELHGQLESLTLGASMDYVVSFFHIIFKKFLTYYHFFSLELPKTRKKSFIIDIKQRRWFHKLINTSDWLISR